MKKATIAMMAIIFPLLVSGCVVVMQDTAPSYHQTYTRIYCEICYGYGCVYGHHNYHYREVVVQEARYRSTSTSSHHHHQGRSVRSVPAAPQRVVQQSYQPQQRRQVSRSRQSVTRQTTTRRASSRSTTQERVKERKRTAKRTKRRR